MKYMYILLLLWNINQWMWHFSILFMVIAYCTHIGDFLHNFAHTVTQIFTWISHYITIFIVFYMHSPYMKISQKVHLFLLPLKSSLHYILLCKNPFGQPEMYPRQTHWNLKFNPNISKKYNSERIQTFCQKS